MEVLGDKGQSSRFRADGRNTVVGKDGTSLPDTYVYETAGTVNWQDSRENIEARTSFMDLESANAFFMNEVYATGDATPIFQANVDNNNMYPPVLCDVYSQKRSGLGGKKTGTPILYFRARSNFTLQNYTIDGVYTDDIYNLDDNITLLDLGMPNDSTMQYSIMTAGAGDEYENFENMIVNQSIQTIRRPYRADTYILISAGKDGDFGTADDVFNFDKEIVE